MRCGHGCLLPACTLTSVLRARAFTRGCGKYGRPSPVPSPSALRPRDAGLRAGRAQMPIVTPTARRLIASATRSHPRPASQTPVATDLLSFLPLSHFQNVVHKWAAFRPLWLQAQLRSRGCHLRGLWDWLSHSLSLSLCTSVLVVLCVSSLFLPVVAWVWTVHRGSAGSLPKGAGLFPVWGCRAWVCRPAWTEVLVSQGGLTPPPARRLPRAAVPFDIPAEDAGSLVSPRPRPPLALSPTSLTARATEGPFSRGRPGVCGLG